MERMLLKDRLDCVHLYLVVQLLKLVNYLKGNFLFLFNLSMRSRFELY